jgi:glycosyltransferase involved in cell wall biosynthesis
VTWPSVGVVVPTKGDRPALLSEALAAIRAQDYQGTVTTAVVFDQAEPTVRGWPDADAAAPGSTAVVLGNERTPGLAGARNTGVLALDTDLVAFCDDDDQWLPDKLSRQVGLLLARPAAEFASCGILVSFDGRTIPRLAGCAEISHADLIRSRMVMVHSSTYLADRRALIDGIGLLDETIPGSQNEDWDLALRAARRQPIAHLDEPLVRVRWSANSHYARQWETKVASLQWMLQHHPEIAGTRRGAARVYGQISFGYACLRDRGQAVRWAGRALRSNVLERRVPFALAVASGAISGDRVLRALHARGHGI